MNKIRARRRGGEVIGEPPNFNTDDDVSLTRLVAKYSWLPHPEVVSFFKSAIFPTRRVRNTDKPLIRN
jgi:hypothetical protein